MEGRTRGPVEERYNRYAPKRDQTLFRARQCAELTVPHLCPPEDSGDNKLPTPHQSIGARGVNNLAAKMLLALFPPNGTFFRLTISEFDLERLVAQAAASLAQNEGGDPAEIAARINEQIRGDVEANLGAVERAIMREFETRGNRPTDFEALKQLIVVGNVVRYSPVDKNEQPRIYALPHYVVKRDPDGTPLEIITREGVTALSVSPAIREACGLESNEPGQLEKAYDLFTHIRREDRSEEGKPRWKVSQELNGIEIPDTEETYPLDECPWVPLRWTKVDGSDYGRSYVEDYLGDLRSCEGLSKATLDGCAAMARLLVLVNPNGFTRMRDVARAPNGKVIRGAAGDVSFLRSDKMSDMRVASEAVENLKRDLAQAFLMTSSIQRNAERVTAQEIRLMAQELETTLGGVYSMLAQEYQLPLVKNLMAAMQKRRELPKLPDDVEPTIVTGIDALGRNADLEKIMQFMQLAGAMPQEMDRINGGEYYTRIAAAIGIQATGLVRPDEQVQAEREARQQQAQQQALVETVGGPLADAGAQAMVAQASAPPPDEGV